MNYATIKYPDIANGEGIRVSLFVSGCTHHCKNCFNPETWDFNYGDEFTKETQNKIIEMLAPNYVTGLTLLGGEPMEPQNQLALLPFIQKVREIYGDTKSIWSYTGYIYDIDLIPQGRAYCDVTDNLLNLIDVLVDGPFIESLKNISLKFRGSSNQRIIDLKKSKKENKIKLYLE